MRERESLTASITAIAEGAATDPRYAQALELLKQGKPAEAEPLLEAVRQDKLKRIDKDSKDAAAATRNLAAIAAISDHKKARELYAEAARLDPSDVEGMLRNGEFQYEAGDLKAAEAAYSRLVDLTKGEGNEDRAVWARFGLGDSKRSRRSWRGARHLPRRSGHCRPSGEIRSWQRGLAARPQRVLR